VRIFRGHFLAEDGGRGEARALQPPLQEEFMRELHWYEIAIAAFAFVIVTPPLALAILPFSLLGLPVFLALVVPVLSAGKG
jgi:hypothetical protein